MYVFLVGGSFGSGGGGVYGRWCSGLVLGRSGCCSVGRIWVNLGLWRKGFVVLCFRDGGFGLGGCCFEVRKL